MTKFGFGKVTVLAVVAAGVVLISASEGCSVSLENNTCAVTTGGSCPAGNSYYTGCGANQTPIVFSGSTCSSTGTAGSYCCTPEVHTDAGGNPDTSTPAEGGPLNSCNECLYQGCSGYWSVCQQNTSCVGIYHCAITCASGDQTCVNNCYAAGTSSGKSAYLRLSTCDNAGLCGSCQATCKTPAASCAVPDGGTPADSSVVDNCKTCVDGLCSAEEGACKAGSDCDDYTQCLTSCSDAPCIDACGLAHSMGQAASKKLGDCTSMNCKSACGL